MTHNSTEASHLDYLGPPMNTWKSSTLLVLAAFTVSLVLLFAKAGMVQPRDSSEEVLVSNYIYSPAAADPNLRSPERAENLRRQQARAQPVAAKTTVEAPVEAPSPKPTATSPPASAKTRPAPSATDSPAKQTTAPIDLTQYGIAAHRVPANHKFYVVAATFSTPDNAKRGLANMKAKGLDASFIGTLDEGKFFSVIANTFTQETQAAYMVRELERKQGIRAYVYHKKE